jgi:hypothetical protein
MARDEDGKEFVWIDSRMVNDPEIQDLTPEEFYSLLMSALDGEENVFSKYVRRDPNPNLD